MSKLSEADKRRVKEWDGLKLADCLDELIATVFDDAESAAHIALTEAAERLRRYQRREWDRIERKNARPDPS